MIDFQTIFEENYQLYLKNVDYKVLTIGPVKEKIDIKLKDDIQFSRDNNKLNFEVKRTINFTPAPLYTLTVAFGVQLTIKDIAANLECIDWNDESRENVIFQNLIQGLMSRISVLISEITLSYGQNPVVTPPNFIYE